MAGGEPRAPPRHLPVTDESAPTLPDLLRPGLDIVFVGINPSVYSAQQGHYFARKINRFWPSFSRSRLSAPARRGLGVAMLAPHHDVLLPDYGFGFTDLVKRPTPNMTGLRPEEMIEGAAVLRDKLARFRPRLVCIHGVTIYRALAPLLGLAAGKAPIALGPQAPRIGGAALFLVPNPSPANAHFTPAQQVEWYDRLAEFHHGGQPSLP